MAAGSVGSIFRDRRERLGIPIEVAADATNIRARLLQTIEDSDFKNYPPHGHAVGMLSSYARYLQLDPRSVLEQYEAEYAAFEAGEEMATSADRARRGLGRFGERVNSADKPLPRDGVKRPGIRNRRLKHEEDDSASKLNEKLDKERVAEGDDRYKSGTVKVVGTRQTGSFRRVRPGSNRSRELDSDSSGQMSPARDYRSGGGRTRRADTAERRGSFESAAQRRYSRSSSGSYSQSRRYGSSRDAASSAETRSAASGSRSTGSYAHTRQDTPTRSSSRSAFEQSREAARRHQDEMSGSRGHEGKSDSLSFFGGVAVDEDRTSSAGRRRPRTHRVSETEQQEKSSGDTIVSQLLDLVKGIFSESRTRIIVLAFAVIVIGVIAAASVLISTAGNNSGDVLDVKGGAEDTSTTTQSPDSATTTVTTTNGSPINVKISVAEGQTSLINVTYDDDSAYSGTAVGPWERSFYVTDSLSASFGNAAAVSVTENGNPVKFETKEDGSGAFNIVITTTTSNTQTSSGNSTSQGQSSSGKQEGGSDNKQQ